MLATLVPTLIEAAFGGGARGFLVGVGVSLLQAAIPLALRQILTAATGGGPTSPVHAAMPVRGDARGASACRVSRWAVAGRRLAPGVPVRRPQDSGQSPVASASAAGPVSRRLSARSAPAGRVL